MSWFTGWYLLLSLILGLIALGFALTCAVGIMKGMLWCLSSSSRLIAWAWAKWTGRAPDSHGSSHWADESEIASKGLFNIGSIPLGTWHGKPLYEASGGHVALIGPPRSRKSWGLLMPAIAGVDGSILVNDPRAELYSHTHVDREARGSTCRFSPTQKESCAVNVMDAVRWGEPEAYGDAQRLVHGLLSPDPGEPWNDFRLEAKPLLEAIVHDRQQANEGNLPAVVRWMTEPSRSMKQKAEALLQSPLPVVSAGGRRLLDKSDRLAAAVWSAALSALTIYQDPLVIQNTSHADVDLRSVQHGTRPVSIFLTPPFADVSRLRPLLATMTEMLTALFSAQQDQPRQKVALFLDEMGNLGRLPELERGQSYLQGCGVQILQVWQNVLQVRQVYGKDSPILAAAETKVFYCPSDQETAADLSEQLGVSTERLRPLSETRTFWGMLSSTTTGTTEHERRLLTADECKRIDESAAVVLVKGCAPILGTKLGSPAPELVDLSKPIMKRVAMLAVGLLGFGLSVGLTSWALMPSTTTPTPTHALTSEPTTGLNMARERAALGLSLPTVTTPETPRPWMIAQTMYGKPWPMASDILGRKPTSFPTEAECQVELDKVQAQDQEAHAKRDAALKKIGALPRPAAMATEYVCMEKP